MLTNQSSNKFPLIALLDYAGFSEVLSLTSAIEIPDNPADHGITGYAGLMTGVLWQARYEALAGDHEAMKWLKSDDCADFCIAINFDHNLVLNWVSKKKHRLKGEKCQY